VSADNMQVGRMDPQSSLSGIFLEDVGSFVVPYVDGLEGGGLFRQNGGRERERETGSKVVIMLGAFISQAGT